MTNEDVNHLKARIQVLEVENNILAQNLDDFLLVNTVNFFPDEDTDIYSTLSLVLEKISVLKNLAFSAIGKVDEKSIVIQTNYSLYGNFDWKGIFFEFNSLSIDRELQSPIILERKDLGQIISALKLNISEYKSFNIIVFPFKVKTLGRFMLFLMDVDSSNNELNNTISLLDNFIKNLSLKLDNIALHANLKKQNIKLDSMVNQRTSELIQTNNDLIEEILERKKAEKELHDNESYLLAILNNAPIIIILVDKDLKIVKINQTGLNIAGKNNKQALGIRAGSVLNCTNSLNDPRGCGFSKDCKFCSLRNSFKYTLETHESIYKVESTLIMGCNENVFERNILVTTEFIEIKDIPSVLIFIDDVTERVQMQNVLKEKSDILLKAQQIAQMGEFHYDIGNGSFRLSPSLKEILSTKEYNISYEELINSMDDEDKNDFRISLENAVSYNDKFNSHFRRIKPDGEVQYLHSLGEVEFDPDGNPSKIFGIINDITEQKQAEVKLRLINYELLATEEELRSTNDALRENLTQLEEAKQKAEESDRLKSTFLANMSHEIRTPMNAIMGFADLLDLEDAPFERRKKFTRTIRERTKDLLNIINDLLDISRIESQTLRIVETAGNINNILFEITEFFRIKNEEIYSKPITFNLVNELRTDECLVVADFERIKQILINLIENAFKFTESGFVTLGCKLKDSQTLLFSVEDTGIGIPPNKINLIFERFRQVDESYLTREYGGAGLGLSICKGILDLINGSIWVESEPGKGSKFFFTLPYNQASIAKTKSNDRVRKTYNYKGKTILIVEDTNANMEYLNELLQPLGFILIGAENGRIAMEMFHQHPNIDLVLMDIRLPDSNGFDLTKMMIAERTGLKVIAQTAYASSEDMQKCLEIGCVDYIAKPINKDHLYEIIENHLKAVS